MKKIVFIFCILLNGFIPVYNIAGSELYLESVKPVFYMPESDIEKGNGIESVFFDVKEIESGYSVECTVVFLDEDHPCKLIDWAYDLIRRIKYKRVKDIETFYLNFDNQGNLKEVKFEYNGKGTYAGAQEFDKGDVKHFTATIPSEEFEIKEGRVLIYINTWNHMFSELKREGLKYKEIGDYQFEAGSRADKFKL